MPFDINERDVTGQNILYVACLLGNLKMVEIILKFRVKATRINCVSIYFIAIYQTIPPPFTHQPMEL